jgi:hypothetical protein
MTSLVEPLCPPPTRAARTSVLVRGVHVIGSCPGLPLVGRLFCPVAGPASSVVGGSIEHRFGVNFALTFAPRSYRSHKRIMKNCKTQNEYRKLQKKGDGKR